MRKNVSYFLQKFKSWGIIMISYFKLYPNYKMVDEKELEEYRETIQKIVDKHLPAEKRFSVQDCSQEEIWYLSRLFLEKDEAEREKIRKEIDEKRKAAHKDLLEEFEDIKAHKEKYDTLFSSIDDINSLKLDIDLDTQLKK